MLKDEINKVYDIFKSIVELNSDKISDKQFVDLIKKDDLNAECNVDKELLKLSVLSSHQEWEGLLSFEHVNLNDCLGVECSVLTEKGIKYFNIPPYELQLLREEVVYGDKKYSTYIDSVNKLQKAYNKNPSDEICRYLIGHSLVLHRVDQVRSYLEELKSFTDNVLLDFELPIYIARLYDEILSYDDEEIYDGKELKVALDLFEQNHEMNKRLNIFDPIIYKIYYIKILKIYLEYLNLEGEYNSDNKYTKFYDQPKNRVKREFGDAKYSFLKELDEDFVFKADEEIISLIEKHDDLTLDILPYVDDIENYGIFPIFKGTNTIIWKYYLNKSFPEKLDYFLIYDEPPKPTIRTPLDIKREKLKEMLLKEFKTDQEVEAINEEYI